MAGLDLPVPVAWLPGLPRPRLKPLHIHRLLSLFSVEMMESTDLTNPISDLSFRIVSMLHIGIDHAPSLFGG